MSSITSSIFELYDREGYNTYGEGINQIEHGVQCAELARRQGASAEMITAALLHDIGHLLAATDIAFGNYKHDAVGADYLAQFFSESVSEPVRLHAQAKRYLCSVEEGYLQSLSEASLDSLQHQGGLMSTEEKEVFLQNPFAELAIQLRRWDDEGKVEELSSGSVRDYEVEIEAALLAGSTNPEINASQHTRFRQHGYVVLPGALSEDDMDALDAENRRLNAHAQQLLEQLAMSGESLADFYRRQQKELIVVPEIDDALKVCRFEYIDASSEVVHERILPRLQTAIEALTGQAFNLFKDKCNEKNPGGGAFEPHQDVIAYDQFAPRYHVTAAIFLDDATSENGCLNFPLDYLADVEGEESDTLMGKLPVLASYDGGPDNGNIQREICEKIRWQEVPAQRGDVVLFDSYVPHYSEKNASDKTRRAMFFTFSPAADGDFYEAYYEMKRNEFDNPKFHVATPTAHSKIAV